MTILASDLGGTRMKIGVVRDGLVLAHMTTPSNSKTGLATCLPYAQGGVVAAAW
jgi:hypothetical protein